MKLKVEAVWLGEKGAGTPVSQAVSSKKFLEWKKTEAQVTFWWGITISTNVQLMWVSDLGVISSNF